MDMHAMGYVVQGQGLIMMDVVLKKDLMGQIQANVSSYTYIMCVLFFFLCYNKGNHTMDAMFLPVCVPISIEMYPCTLGQLI